MAKNVEIRNSTAEFLTFVAANKEDGVQVVYKDETIWATQAAMGELFGCSSDNIGVHLKNIFAEGELQETATTEKISVVQLEGSRNVNREPTFYNLDAIIAAGYCVSKTVLSGIHTINVMKVGSL
ncbi:MAG: death-on-curing protein [Paludibacteraceae bacterium]|nr:death-on-curing protein [Paludibacteraceae bacterium]